MDKCARKDIDLLFTDHVVFIRVAAGRAFDVVRSSTEQRGVHDATVRNHEITWRGGETSIVNRRETV
jgi:hypothetical protein